MEMEVELELIALKRDAFLAWNCVHAYRSELSDVLKLAPQQLCIM